MALRIIRLENDPVLRKKSKAVKEINENIITLLDDMAETLEKQNGLGLAAPQVGVLRRVVIIDARAIQGEDDEPEDAEGTETASGSNLQEKGESEPNNVEIVAPAELLELINPEIIETTGVQRNSEACLSLPGRSGVVERPARVVVKALNRAGEEITVVGTGVLAIALCHELDHLDGILYTDKAVEMSNDVEEGRGR